MLGYLKPLSESRQCGQRETKAGQSPQGKKSRLLNYFISVSTAAMAGLLRNFLAHKNRDMTKLSQYGTRIPQIYGAFIAIGLIAYFWICYLLGVIHVLELRIFNFVIMCAGVYLAMKQFRRTHNGHLNYFKALSIGVATSFIGTSAFVFFLFILFNLNREIYQTVVKAAPMGIHLNAWIATSAVWFEGMFSGFMATFLLVNAIDTDSVNT